MIGLTQEEYEADLADARREGWNDAVEACTAYATQAIDEGWFDMSCIITVKREVSDE